MANAFRTFGVTFEAKKEDPLFDNVSGRALSNCNLQPAHYKLNLTTKLFQ